MWFALDVTIDGRAREAVEYGLMEAGAQGTEEASATGEAVRVTAYFDAPPEVARVRAALDEALAIYGLDAGCVREMSTREVAERDWLAEWKKSWKPVEIGRRFLIAPSWSEIENSPDGRIVIRIEPGMAFGTGTHETTRLCLAAIEKHFRGGSFLDVGTGTGILAIAAAELAPEAHVEACDTDPLAVTIAHENARLNGVAERINFRVGSLDEQTAAAALVCANLTADMIAPMLPDLLRVTGERLILSGILATQHDMLHARLIELGVADYEVTRDGEWIAMVI